MNASSSPSSSQASSFSGSPPPYPSLLDSVPLIPPAPPVDRRLSEIATAKLAALTEFPPTVNQDEITVARYLSDTELCEAFKEIDGDIFKYFSSKAISNKALDLILGYCPALQSLNLFGFSQITEVALPRITQLSRLTTLNLSQTQVRNLAPLIAHPLPFLRTVNFSDTPIDSVPPIKSDFLKEPETLLPFLECHSICNLSLPKKLPTGFFDRFASNSLIEISLHWDNVGIEEFASFLKRAPVLKKVEIWTDTMSVVMKLIAMGNELGKDVTVITPSGKFSYTSNFMS